MTSKDLGLVTAYAYAVSQGYTGTEEEFAELMASYATVAEEAAESAAEAAASATAAGTSETNAAASAASATQSATAAGQSASSASGSAVQAQASATAAGQSATQASGSATAAGNSATAAAGSATQAAASETAAGASATAAAGSATSAGGSATAAATSATEADASADRAQEILDSIPEDYSELSDDVTALKSAMSQVETMSSAAFITEDASGAVVAISDGADGVPSKGYTLNVKPHQSGSGDPSPDNVRLITGYTSVDVTRAGGNIVDNTPLPVTLSGSTSVNLALPTGTLQRLIESNATVTLHIDGVLGEDKTSYAIYAPSGSENPAMYIGSSTRLDASTNFTLSGLFRIQGASASYAYADILRIYVQPYTGSATSTINSVQFCVGDTVIAESGALTETIPFPTEAGTVYGGTLTRNADGSGTLTVDRASVVLNGTQIIGQLNWRPNNESVGWLYPMYVTPGIKSQNDGYQALEGLIADSLKTLRYSGSVGIFDSTENSIAKVVSDTWGIGIRIRDTTLTTNAAINAYLAAHPITVVYPVETPTTYTIPAEDMAKIPTLKGSNTVWMSADGTIDLEYCADPKLYIGKLITPIQTNIAYLETGTTASRAYTVGQYVIVGDVLYKVASSIASGATFTPGTNIIATTVGGELTALNA